MYATNNDNTWTDTGTEGLGKLICSQQSTRDFHALLYVDHVALEFDALIKDATVAGSPVEASGWEDDVGLCPFEEIPGKINVIVGVKDGRLLC